MRDSLVQLADEGFMDDESNTAGLQRTIKVNDLVSGMGSVHDTEGECGVLWLRAPLMKYLSVELAYRLLASLPRSRLATIQRRIAPLLQFDVVGVRIPSSWYIHQVLTSIYARLVSSNGGLAADILLPTFSNAPGLRPCQSTMASPVERLIPLEDPLPNTRMDVEAHASITSFQLPCTTTPP